MACRPTDPPPVSPPAPSPPERRAEAPASPQAITRRDAPRPSDGKPADATTPEARRAFHAALRDGRKATAREQFKAAISAFDAALTAIPDHPRALSGRGYAKLLDGDLDGAAADLERALTMSPPAPLRAAVHFNLGLVAERRGDDREAWRQFQLSHALRPGEATASRLADGPRVCSARIDRTTAEPRRYAGWPELAREVSARALPAAEARAALCGRDGSSDREGDRCVGEPPWHIVNAQLGGWEHRLVRPDGGGLLVLELGAWMEQGCGGFDELELVRGDPLLIRRAAYDGAISEQKRVGDGLAPCTDEDEDCLRFCTFEYDVSLEYAVVDPVRLRRLLGARIEGVAQETKSGPSGGPKLGATLEPGGLRLTGEHCDEVVPLATNR